MFSAIAQFFAGRRTGDVRTPWTVRVPVSYQTTAGVPMTPDRALLNAAVWACVRYLSTTVAQLPWPVKERLPDDAGSRHANRNAVDWILNGRPNPEVSPFQFKETLIVWALLWGNGYAEIVRDGASRPVELWLIEPWRVTVKRRPETGALFYEVAGVEDFPKAEIPPEDMFHVRGFGHGPVGLSIVDHAAQTIGWAQAAELFGAAFFGNNLSMGGVIEGAGALGDEAWKRLQARLQQTLRGPRKAHSWIPLDAGMKATRFSVAPNEAQMVETMQFQVEQICRWFGVPPHKVMHLLRSTFNNIEHQSIEVVVDAITPWCTRLEQEANYKLFGPRNQGRFFTEFDLTALLRGDNKTRADYLRKLQEGGVLSVNEIRAMEGWNTIPGGDVRVMQSQYTTIERIGQDPVPTPAPAAQEPDIGEADEPEPDDDPAGPTDEDMAASRLLYERVMGGVHHAA